MDTALIKDENWVSIILLTISENYIVTVIKTTDDGYSGSYIQYVLGAQGKQALKE